MSTNNNFKNIDLLFATQIIEHPKNEEKKMLEEDKKKIIDELFENENSSLNQTINNNNPILLVPVSESELKNKEERQFQYLDSDNKKLEFDFKNAEDQKKKHEENALNLNIDFDNIINNLQDSPELVKEEKKELRDSERNFFFQDKEVSYIKNEKKNNHSSQVSKFDTNITYSQMISNDKSYGKKSIERVDEKDINQRKSNIIKNSGFSSIKLKNLSENHKQMLPYWKKIEDSLLNEYIASIFNDVIIGIDLENLKITILSHSVNELDNSGPIGPICSLDSMAFVGGLINCKSQLEDLSKDIGKWRSILGEGNCFYRAFMFSYLEINILKKNIQEIKRFILDFSEKIKLKFKRRDFNVNKNQVIAVFCIIIEYLEKGDVKNAFDILIKAYDLFINFDLALVKYMRIAISHFIRPNKNCLYNIESNLPISNLLPQTYILENNDFDFEGFIDEDLLSMQNEAEKIVIYLSPIIFNIKLEIHILEGATHIDFSDIKYFKEIIPCSNPFSPTVTLLYRFSHYDKIYKNTFLEDFQTVFTKYQMIQSLSPENRIIIIGDMSCKLCQSNSQLIELILINLKICKNCLINFIEHVIYERVKNFIYENYNNIEFYSRPIEYSPSQIIKDEDVVILTQKNIYQYFIAALDCICVNCKRLQKEHELIKLTGCHCKACRKCIINKMRTMTNDKVILNAFEKKYSPISQANCFCGVAFNYEESVKIVVPYIMEYYDRAEIRLMETVKNFCMICNMNNARRNLYSIKEVQIMDKIDFNHSACIKCLIAKKQEMKKEKNGTNTLYCCICDVDHTVPAQTWMVKREEEGCCLIF